MLSNQDPDLLSLPPAQETDFLPPIGRWTKVSGLVIVASVALAAPLAAIAKYKEIVQGPAAVRPIGELRLVQSAIEGAVTYIAATENQTVRKGDILASIDDSRLQTRKSQLQNNVQQSQLQLLQIKAQMQALDSQITAESDRIQRSISAAEATLSQRRREYQDQASNTQARVIEAIANLKATEAAFNAAQVKFKRFTEIAETGVISKGQLEESKLAVEQQAQAIEAARARLQTAETAMNPSEAEVAIAIERIAQEKASGDGTLASFQKDREALIQQQIQIQNQLDRDLQELQQVGLELEKTTILATADGIISRLNLRNSGQMVRPGEEIAQIAPTDTQLLVRTLVSAQDISKVKTGQTVHMRISACPYPDYGTLTGKVQSIAPDVLPETNNREAGGSSNRPSGSNNGNASYIINITPEQLALTDGNKQCPIQLGMEGKAEIITREDTFLNFLLRKARLVTDL